MGTNSSKELSSHNQPCRLKDVNEKLHQIVMDFIHESSTAAQIAEKREEHLKELQQQQQLADMHQHAMASAAQQQQQPSSQSLDGDATGSSTSPNSTTNNNGNDQQQQQDPYAPQPIPTLGIAVELRNKSSQAGTGEQIETVHRIWVALTLPGVGLGDAGAHESASALEKAAHLEFLDLAYNDITADGLCALCPAISASEAGASCLRFLRFSGNEIQSSSSTAAADSAGGSNDEMMNGINAVANLIESCPMLQEVQLFNCGITDAGVLALVNALRLHENIRYINLGKNRTTRKSILMLTELVKRCKTILAVSVDAETTKDSDFADLEAALDVNRAESDRREQARQVLEQKRLRREAQEKEESRKREEETRGERLRIEAEIAEKEAERLQHEENIHQQELLKSEKEAANKAHRQQQRAAQSDEAINRAMQHAQEWKAKLGVASGKSAIYQDGFSMYTRQLVVNPRDGSTKEVMVSYERNPNRLKACWCDPADAAVPYARKLHYHCKHENAAMDLLGAAKDLTDTAKYTTSDLPTYQGCRASGHICASVGHYTKPLPNKTAAHFFSSQHPSYEEEDNNNHNQQGFNNNDGY